MVYSKIIMPDTVILIGPNHVGMGRPISIMSSGIWEIPTGQLVIDDNIAKTIMQRADNVSNDEQAHYYEHSLEVQLPFIYHFNPKTKIVPITISTISFDECKQLGHTIASIIKDTAYPVVIVASTDMNHYENDDITRIKDKMALDKLLALDAEGLYHVVRSNRITMCGFIPTTVMLAALNELEAKTAKLVKYMTSGDVSGDYNRVVGYAGVIIV
jgi:AmmeMemoRadiSam system protein B